ncbi:sugar transferase [Rathayibacter sp. YIM 133350]|uniref:sugar transferase n=1 Tax=Rathayibacter sp. YIM 133350 TaxID=3131992 RepID=UPI00307FC461
MVIEKARMNARSVTDWRRGYMHRLAATDALVLIWVVFGAQIFWLGFDREASGFSGSRGDLAVSYTIVSVVLIGAWMLVLRVFGTRGYRVIGAGSQEYRLVVNASIWLFGIVAIVAFLVKLDLARGYILIAFPLGIAVLIFSRWLWRQWLRVQRQQGRFSSTVVLVGSARSSAAIARQLKRVPDAGYRVVGACVDGAQESEVLMELGIPVLGGIAQALPALESSGADTLVITSSDELPPERVRELSWGLEPGRQHLVVAPSLVDIGGPRIHTRPVAGLPLIHVETPTYEGRKHFAKRTFDVVGSALLLLLLSPVFLLIAVAVKVTSPGPVFYRQERIGLNEKPFAMLKFRSMTVGADAQLRDLLEAQGTHGTPLFKVKNDPRLTRIGGFLRTYSLDELPQLLNVFIGNMSLVGPRPQREGEVELYDSAARRRLLVQPGMTGLWQVSGRSSLSWEDAMRLDLYYVENWSLTGDIVILWRTARAVTAGDGAF